MWLPVSGRFVMSLQGSSICKAYSPGTSFRRRVSKSSEKNVTQSKPQQPPQRHHYIPEFYQRKWTSGKNGQLFVFQRHNGRVHCRLKSPAATGYVERLYAMNDVPPEEAQVIETQYMSPVDSLAATARDRLLDRRQLTTKERGAWVQFILSLLMRTPEELTLYKALYRKQAEKYRYLLEHQYLKTRGEHDPETYAEHLQQIGPGGIEKKMMKLFLQMTSNEKLGLRINSMSWVAIDMRKADYELMTSDRPLVIPYGLGRDHAYIAMPISPDTLFLAINKEEIVMRQIAEVGFSELTTHINSAVVGNACKYVYAYDKSQARFIENRFGELPRWSLVQRMMERFERDEAREPASGLAATGPLNVDW